jgi:nucleoside 2-deoxyribosyltransferase
MAEPQLSVVISGSFRKHFSGIQSTLTAFEEVGIKVLSPHRAKVVNPGEEFAILESDDTSDPETLQQRHFDAITAADALYVFNPEGYVGASATMELGWALALGKPVFAKEVAADFTLKLFCKNVLTPAQIRDVLLERRKNAR